jgi:uncharacterized LabA/DUF88 family protein
MSTTRTRRTVVFIDYQNMYRSARDAFGWSSEAGHFGNFRPYGLGRQMVREPDRMLTEVRVYTGIHTPVGNAVQNAMMQRRMSAWVAEQPDKIQVFPRPLRYSPKRPNGEEKGVDVELAIDIVSLALDDVFDVCVLASADTDLVPSLQLVADRFPDKTIVTLGLQPMSGCEAKTPAPLDLPRGTVIRRRIPQSDFDRMVDKRNFYDASSDLRKAVDSVRWERISRRFG